MNLPRSGNSQAQRTRMLDFDPLRRPSIRPMSTARLVSLCLLAAYSGLAASATQPLFADDELLEVTIAAPLSSIMIERPTDEEMPGTLSYVDAEAGQVLLDVDIRTRGRYRQQKDVCPFAPLRLDFKKGQTKDTLFHKTDKVKLVTHCRDASERYSQGVLKEYLAYRILNTMTDRSFRVRLLRVTYVDTDGKKKDRVNFGFLIEHNERLAKRLDMEVSDQRSTTVAALDGSHTNVGSVFQFLIGNTDFSPILGASGEPCCHNYVLLRPADGGALLSVPYDFDMSGIVSAKHATPNPRFRLRNVRQRLYRGRCANNRHLDDTLQAYRDRRPDIDRLVTESRHMSKGTRKFVSKYIDEFYKTINNPKTVKSRLRDKCLG